MEGGSIAFDPVPRTEAITANKWALSPVTIADHAEIERRIVALQLHPLEEVKGHLSGLSEEHARYLLDAAYRDTMTRRRATPDQVREYLESSDGICLLVWLSVRKRQPEVSETDVAKTLAGLTREQVAALLGEISLATGYAKN